MVWYTRCEVSHKIEIVSFYASFLRFSPHIALRANEFMQVLAEQNSVFIQFRVASQNSFAVIVGLAVDAEPDLAWLDVGIQQIEDHVGLQNTVATIRFEMLPDLKRINQTNR